MNAEEKKLYDVARKDYGAWMAYYWATGKVLLKTVSMKRINGYSHSLNALDDRYHYFRCLNPTKANYPKN